MTRPAGEADPSLTRIERDSAIITVAAAAIALAAQGGRPDGALGVLGGAALMGVSYAAIRGGVSALLQRAAGTSRAEAGERLSRGRLAWTFVTFIGRYAVVGLAAWVMLVPLKAHPLGLVAGVSAPILAIGAEAVRLVRAPARRGEKP